MGGDAINLAQRLFAATLRQWPGETLELLAEDVVINSSDGHIYVGHEGWARWYEHHLSGEQDQAYVPESAELLREHWVLMKGATERTMRDGEKQLQPGCWLVHVRAGQIAAVLYYRTEQDARAALSEQHPDD